MTPEELESIVKSNQLALARVEGQVKKVKKILVFSQLSDLFKVIIVLVPVILGTIYLTPFLKKSLTVLQPWLSNFKANTSTVDSSATSQTTQNQFNSPSNLVKDFCNPELREIYIKNLCK
jgi:hypothetical protein